jgi:hypothetical protein
MSHRFERAPDDEFPLLDDDMSDTVVAGGALMDRRRRLPPIVSVALVVAVVAAVAGIGLGYRLGQASQAAPPAPTAVASRLPHPSPTAQPDLQADTVSDRLQVAWRAASAGSWAICDVGSAVTCRALIPSLSVSPAVSHTFGFTNSEMAQFGQPAIPAGHIVLAAGLGEGITTGSLIAIDATLGQVRGHALTPIDPGRSGVDYFDLGRLTGGSYGIVLGFIPQAGDGTTAPELDSYLASFDVTG